jgi:hypothetical protein
MSKESKAQKKGEGGSYNAASKRIENPYFRKKLKKSKQKNKGNRISFSKDGKGWLVH